MRQFWLSGLLASALIGGAAQAQTLPDPLIGFTWGGSSSVDNPGAPGGNLLLTGPNPTIDFGFNVDPQGLAGDYVIKILVPTEEDPNPSTLSFGLNNVTLGTTSTATLKSTTPWSSGQLDTYLGLTESPTNSIGHYVGTTLGGTNTVDTAASAYYVYTADLGQNTLTGSSAGAGGSPQLQLTNGVPAGSFILGDLLNTSNGNIATANSGAFLEGSPIIINNNSIPEPGSLLLLGTGLIGIGAIARLRARTSA